MGDGKDRQDQGDVSQSEARAAEASGTLREKRVRAKEETARQGRHLSGGAPLSAGTRLPPGQNLVQKWPVLDLGIQPDIPKENWTLSVDGAVNRPVTWDWPQFMQQPQTASVSDIHCVTTWSRYDNRWEGVSTAHILEVVQPLPEARHVIFHSHDGYTTNVTLEHFMEESVLLAHSWEGQELTREHGGPVRVIMPRWYFWKSAKWIRRLEFSPVDKPGFWEVRGYHNEADPWKEDRYG